MRPFVLHAHFYQPERSNPWTGGLDPEPGAAPDRDWNERILRECYHPNGAARIYDEAGRVSRIVNNYERLSFNFGPTLLNWMEAAHPRTYARVLDGDWRSVVRTGHGNALAQAYNHLILPLADDRDRRTQIAWGLADFAHRFRRPAEGMWLPETAADGPTIDALIDARVGFTVLAPHQAWRVRSPGGPWREVGAAIDTGRPYLVRHSDGSGRSLAVYFYDGALARSLAFDPAARDAAVIVDRLAAAGGDGLLSAALDGETFGHHNPFAELGLAYALFEAAERRGLSPTSYAAHLAEHPPVDDVELVPGEGTAWSCAHGVGRWYRDCGCSTGGEPGWDQAWRTPLRQALDVVRDAARAAFAGAGTEVLRDPWAARDAYVHVRLGTVRRQEFLERHGRRSLSADQQVMAWRLLEAQRHAMVMYTSCGWFFADIASIEPVYVLRSAARVLGLLRAVGLPTPDAEVEEVLATARSNAEGVGTGADVWRTRVLETEVTSRRIAQQTALLGLLRPPPARSRKLGHDVEVRDRRHEARGRLALTTARVRVTSCVSGGAQDFAVAAVYLGGLDVHGAVGDDPGAAAFGDAVHGLWASFPTASVGGLIHGVAAAVPGEEYGFERLLPDGRQVFGEHVLGELTERFHDQIARLYGDHRRLLEMLVEAGYDLPRDLRATAELTLAAQLERRLAAALPADGGPIVANGALEAVRATLHHATAQGYRLDLGALDGALGRAVEAATRAALAAPSAATVEVAARWIALGRELGLQVDLTVPQELVYEVAVKARAGRLGADEGEAVELLGAHVGLGPSVWTGDRG